MLVLNKIDLLDDERLDLSASPLSRTPSSVSAETGAGLEELLEGLDAELLEAEGRGRARDPFDRGELVARVHEEGDVLEETYTGEGTRLTARLRSESLPDFTPVSATPAKR